MSGIQHDENLRSLHSRNPAFVKFINKTERNVSVEWLDFTGKHMVYENRLQPDKVMPMNTFKTHPWVFYETVCRHPLAILPNFEKVYFPLEWNGGRRVYHEVKIVDPLLTLRQTSLNFLHRYLVEECGYRSIDTFKQKVDEIFNGLPLVLADDLKQLSIDQHTGKANLTYHRGS